MRELVVSVVRIAVPAAFCIWKAVVESLAFLIATGEVMTPFRLIVDS